MPAAPSSASRDCSTDEEDFCNGCFVRPARVSASARRRVRALVGTEEWRFERRRGYVRPPQYLPCGGACAVADLGECGDRKCGNYRLGEKTWDVRPTFLDFCVEHIRRAVSPAALKAGIIYVSLGSGQLLFDWQLLERLTLEEGARLRAVHLIDQDYGGPKKRDSAVRAQQVLAGWYFDQDWDDERGPCACAFRSFLSAPDFQRWALRNGEEAHILLDCDAVGARKRVDISAFRRAAMRSDGICLVLSNPAKRTAIVKRRVWNGGSSGDGLRVLEQHVYRRGEWRRPQSVSCSRTRSRSRRRSDSQRRRRRQRSSSRRRSKGRRRRR
mmetsp:Transcript_98332/g.273504  ORF Transcript_98332/g.273504 Transcript_98332/m.273504 type:complete len:327 (+) Transcript_98332:158-1138(+)